MSVTSRKFISYRRVSTEDQGRSGLGLEAQTEAVKRHVASQGGIVVADYEEVESGRNCEREQLARALAHAKRSKATLIIGKLDRLSRNAAFLLGLLDSDVEIVAADNPMVNTFTLKILAVIAENEARQISTRVKEALAALKSRGVLLGSARPGHWDGREHLRLAGLEKGRAKALAMRQQLKEAAYADILPMMQAWRVEGLTLRQIAAKLNEAGHSTRRGKRWGSMQVHRVLEMGATS